MKSTYLLISLSLFLSTHLLFGQQDLVDKLHRQKFEYMIAQKTDLLFELLDEDLTYIHSNGWIETKSEVIENINSGKLKYHSVEIQRADVRYIDQVAILTGEAIFTVSLDGQPLKLTLVYTEVYVQEGDNWRLTARHAARVPDQK
jgi:hypothetical protein